MARRIAKPQATPAPAPDGVGVEEAQFAAQEAEDQEILHPERAPMIAGRQLVMREYGFIEGMKLQAMFKPFLDDLYAKFSRFSGPPPAAEVKDLFAVHMVAVQWFMAQAMSKEEDDEQPQAFVDEIRANGKWIAKLGEADGELLMSVWWVVNRNFFTQRLRERAEAAKRAAASPSAPADSTQP